MLLPYHPENPVFPGVESVKVQLVIDEQKDEQANADAQTKPEQINESGNFVPEQIPEGYLNVVPYHLL